MRFASKKQITMSTTIESRVKKVIAKKLEIDPEKIKLDTRLVEDLGMDSLGQVEMMMNFEEEFKDLTSKCLMTQVKRSKQLLMRSVILTI